MADPDVADRILWGVILRIGCLGRLNFDMEGKLRASVTISGLGRLFNGDLRGVLEAARIADEVGIYQVVLPDHLAIGPRLDRYPFAEKFPYPPEEPWLEPITTLAAIAAVTTRVRLATGVLISPVRPALLTAKSVATLDVLSNGRVDLGVGSGWQREEFVDAGLGFVGRTSRMMDSVRACRALWEQAPPVSFASESVTFTDLWCEPRPVQSRIPIGFGGPANALTAERIAELGDGWLPIGVMPDEEIAMGLTAIRSAYADKGRDASTIEVRVGLPGITDAKGRVDFSEMKRRAGVLENLGVTTISVALGRFLAGPEDIGPFIEGLGAAFS